MATKTVAALLPTFSNTALPCKPLSAGEHCPLNSRRLRLPSCPRRCPGLAGEEARQHLRASLPCLADLSLHE